VVPARSGHVTPHSADPDQRTTKPWPCTPKASSLLIALGRAASRHRQKRRREQGRRLTRQPTKALRAGAPPWHILPTAPFWLEFPNFSKRLAGNKEGAPMREPLPYR
jgi:hypothetical protein